jgi:hypothetical protein
LLLTPQKIRDAKTQRLPGDKKKRSLRFAFQTKIVELKASDGIGGASPLLRGLRAASGTTSAAVLVVP